MCLRWSPAPSSIGGGKSRGRGKSATCGKVWIQLLNDLAMWFIPCLFPDRFSLGRREIFEERFGACRIAQGAMRRFTSRGFPCATIFLVSAPLP
jgi:hypothetical protein